MRKICIITGTRAKYGLLYWLMKEIQEDDKLELKNRNPYVHSETASPRKTEVKRKYRQSAEKR